MSFIGDYQCGRCNREITGDGVVVNYEGLEGLSHFKDKLDLCSDCFSKFMDWVNNPESSKLGPVEQVAKREDSGPTKLGPVERVARREDSK